MPVSATKPSRKTRSDKFPLTLHPTGQYCKKIRGKLHYFGKDKQVAYQRYLEQAANLHAGRIPKSSSSSDNTTVKLLCNTYLDHQESRVLSGEIKQRQLHDQTLLLRKFAKAVGPNKAISDIATADLQNYRNSLIRQGKAASTINNQIAAIKAVFHWALENERIDKGPILKAVKKIPTKKTPRQTFTIDQIGSLLEHANVQMRAMIWLGLNCAFGCTDCAELQWEHVNFRKSRVVFSRTKTGIARDLPLWGQTVSALKVLPRINERVFNTTQGNSYVRIERKVHPDGNEHTIAYNSISKEFSRLLKKAEITTEKGVGFYTLRRTAATLAARSGDPFAVQRLLGHADLKMASTYVQDVSEQTDRVINQTRQLIVQGDS